MIEFTISFWYNNQEQRAGVVRSLADKAIKYNVRPIDVDIVKKFGKQIIIFKENGNYKSNNHTDKYYKEFFDSVVKALKRQDREEE